MREMTDLLVIHNHKISKDGTIKVICEQNATILNDYII